jgi:hypothetical protein
MHKRESLLDISPLTSPATTESDNKNSSKENNQSRIPGKPVLIENNVVEEKPFKTNDELPETELYFGGEKETESEHDQRMIRINQQEELSRL